MIFIISGEMKIYKNIEEIKILEKMEKLQFLDMEFGNRLK